MDAYVVVLNGRVSQPSFSTCCFTKKRHFRHSCSFFKNIMALGGGGGAGPGRKTRIHPANENFKKKRNSLPLS